MYPKDGEPLRGYMQDHGNFRGVSGPLDYQRVVRALDQFPDDPGVLYRCLSLLEHYAMPVGDDYSSSAPPRSEGQPLLARALAGGEAVLAAHPAPDSRPLQLLFCQVNATRALGRLLERPSDAELAKASHELEAVFDQFEQLGRPRGPEYRDDLRGKANARRRAWQLLGAAPAYPQDLRDRLVNYLNAAPSSLQWPLAPLVHDPRFQDDLTAELARRSADRAHPAPARQAGYDLPELRLGHWVFDKAEPAEALARLRLILWLGVDEKMFGVYASQVIEDRAPVEALAMLLGLGFDPDAQVFERNGNPRDDGYSLLGLAVATDHLEAVRLLMAAGADPDHTNTPAKKAKVKKSTVRDLAKARKKRAIIDALEGTTRAPSKGSAELGAKLRAAAAALPSDELTWLAGTFGKAPDPAKAIEAALAKSPETPEQVLEDLAGAFVADRYVVAKALRAAGYAIDRKLRGPAVLEDHLTVSGDLIVDGALVDGQGATCVVAGDVRVGTLATEADLIVGGSVTASELVWGDYNDGSLVVVGDVTAPLVVMTDHVFEHRGRLSTERELVDAEPEELAKVFVKQVFEDEALERTRAVKLLAKRAPILVGAKQPTAKQAAPAKPKKSGAKSAKSGKKPAAAKPKPKSKRK